MVIYRVNILIYVYAVFAISSLYIRKRNNSSGIGEIFKDNTYFH